MRKTTKQSLALADLNKAWSAFYQTTKVESEKDLAKQGWKTIRAISEDTNSSVASIYFRVSTGVRRGLLETKKAKIQTDLGIREIKFYRPISK